MGAAIVASDLPGINEALTDGKTGLLVPQQDPRALGAAIDRLLTDEPLRAGIGAAAAVRANDYSLTSIGLRYRDVVRNMALDGNVRTRG
jgi:glycosyltransferase involved in cell wall biosynthesis